MSQHTAPPKAAPSKGPSKGPSRRALLTGAVVGVVVMFVAVLGFAWFSGGSDPAATGPSAVAANELGPAAPGADLPASTTYTTIEGAPSDPNPDEVTDGIVVHPVRETPVYDGPDGRAIARMEPTQFGDTWLPVIAEAPGFVQVLLPSRPDAATGWVRADDVERARTPYVVNVHVGSKRLELLRDGESVGEWPIAVGKEDTPTPTGRTFLLGAFSDPNQHYSPVILPLGTHSPTHDTFGGGPGTVAIHTWPESDVFGKAVSEGCIRVPADALDQLAEVPLGTLVMIDQD
jgi:lipoprotein-anchoring transpeptidase ErfK/SrfK